MSDRDRGRDRDRDRGRDRERERRRDKDDRERDRLRRDRDRTKRSRTPDRTRTRRAGSQTRSPDHHRSRSRTPDRSGRRHHHRHRSSSPDPPRKRHKRGEEDSQRAAAAVSEFVEGIAREQQKHQKGLTAEGDGAVEGGGDGEIDADEIEMMKMLGIPIGFDSTKGKHVPGADVSGVRAVTKRQPRQYMNRRGGFNRPLPAEKNR